LLLVKSTAEPEAGTQGAPAIAVASAAVGASSIGMGRLFKQAVDEGFCRT